MISPCGFDLRFSDDRQCCASFHVPVGHLCVFSTCSSHAIPFTFSLKISTFFQSHLGQHLRSPLPFREVIYHDCDEGLLSQSASRPGRPWLPSSHPWLHRPFHTLSAAGGGKDFRERSQGRRTDGGSRSPQVSERGAQAGCHSNKKI